MPSKKERNPWLTKGVRKYPRWNAYTRKGRYNVKNKTIVKPSEKQKAEKKEKSFRQGTRDLIRPRPSRFYPGEDVKRRISSRKMNHVPPRVRNSLQPGTVVILLSGRFRGSRVVLLSRLPSGLLLVTGPYVWNGVPIRRVNPAYVIATSTKVDIGKVKLPENMNDDYFRRPAKKRTPKSSTPEDRFNEQEKPKEPKVLDPKRVEDQKTVDELLLPALSAVPLLKEYLKTKFTLDKHQYPHLMKF